MWRKFALALVMAVATGMGAACAAGQATPDEAKDMALRAAAYLKEVGPATALPAFSAKDGPWHDRDLYVTVQDNKGFMVAHGTNPGLVGRSVLELKDVDGKPFNHEIQEIKEPGWIDYKWRNPVTNAVEAKTSYNVREGDYIIGVGAYKK
jgi:cytochrome c